LTFITLDPKKVEDLILSGSYEKAASELFEIIEQPSNSDKELIFDTLTLLNKICDKSPAISLRTVKNLANTINDLNSWVRLVSLEILYQVTMYRPNLLIDLMHEIRLRLFDQESSIRRLAVKIMGNLILSLHIDKEELQNIIEEFTEKLMDNDWKVKLQVIKTLKKILNQDYTKIREYEPLLSIVIVNLRDEDDDVARSAAELLKIIGTYFLSKEKITYVLLNLLYNEKSRVKELIIWLFGEIGKEGSPEIIPIIPKLINLLKENNYRIQLRVIDSLVTIAENNFDQIWVNLITALYTGDSEFRNIVINALYHLCQSNIMEIFNYIFEEFENPSENVRDGVALVFKRLYEEYQVEIENEITKILYLLESKYWRERKKTIILLRNICFILESKKVAVWIFIELEKNLRIENDPDVSEEIIYTIKNIKSNFQDIDEIIQDVNEDLSIFVNKIQEFQKIPAQFREKMNLYIKEFKFHQTEIELDKIYRKILNKIKKFNTRLNKFEYKRLAFNLIEDWEETKITIMDELSIIKAFISEVFEEKKEEFTLNLKSKIKLLEDRISILKAQYEDIQEYNFLGHLDDLIIDKVEDKELEEKFTQITQLRNYMFKLDDDIREVLVTNVEFNEVFKTLLSKWVGFKIELQEFLSDLDRKIKSTKDRLVNEIQRSDGTDDTQKLNLLSSILFQGHIQSIITQGLEGLKRFNNNLDNLKSKLETLLKKSEFSDARKLIEMNTNQIQNYIEDYENQIDNLIGKVTEDNDVFNLFARPSVTKFVSFKEVLINKLKVFNQKSNDELILSQIKYYLDVINPIKLESLASYIDMDINLLKERVVKFVNKNKLSARIIKDELYSPKREDIIEPRDILFFKNIKTIGNNLYFNFKLNNPTNLLFSDLQISLKIPEYLTFIPNESFPKYLYLKELKPGNVFKFNYVLKLKHNIEKNLSDPSVDEVNLNIYYKDPFDMARKITKKISLLLP
jgi:HEAT repeat protein